MIYVLIVIALFAALSFVLSRGNNDGESAALSAEKINIAATQILQNAAHLQQGIERMTYSGVHWDDLDFSPPSAAGFETDAHTKIFHPAGGGVTLPSLPADAVDTGDTNPVAGFYLGKFNNVEWSQNDAQGNPVNDAIITAYQIDRAVCARLNQQITGDPAIPTLGKPARDILIDRTTAPHTGTNSDFEIADCAACENKLSLCVKDAAQDIWAFYQLVLARPVPF